MWTKVKCFFKSLQNTKKLKEEQIEGNVQTLNIKEEFGNNVGETLNVNITKTKKDSDEHQHSTA